jgi:peptidyl-prolyl cis-trans isomerase B (cyclophilin B)
MGRMIVGTAVFALLPALAAAQPAPVSAPAPKAGPAAAQEVVVATDAGDFVIRLRPDLAPQHVRHFLKTAAAGGYDHTTFHRIIAGGIIQGGDPLSKDPAKARLYGTGGLGLLKAEFTKADFVRGTVAAARRPSSVDSGGSQFFVCLQAQPSLKGQYTVFGEVVSGIDVADAIGRTPVAGDKAAQRVEIKSVTLRTASGS